MFPVQPAADEIYWGFIMLLTFFIRNLTFSVLWDLLLVTRRLRWTKATNSTKKCGNCQIFCFSCQWEKFPFADFGIVLQSFGTSGDNVYGARWYQAFRTISIWDYKCEFFLNLRAWAYSFSTRSRLKATARGLRSCTSENLFDKSFWVYRQW